MFINNEAQKARQKLANDLFNCINETAEAHVSRSGIDPDKEKLFLLDDLEEINLLTSNAETIIKEAMANDKTLLSSETFNEILNKSIDNCMEIAHQDL